MVKVDRIRAEFVELIPKTLENGILYVSNKYKTASHLCCCGCGSKVVTPLKAGGWQVTVKRGAVTLFPSIGSWALPCQSHYWIRGNTVEWAPRWSKAEIEAGRRRDQRDRERAFDGKRESIWSRICDWIRH